MKKCVYFHLTGFVFVITLFLLILPVKSFSQIEFHQYGIIKNYQQGSDIDVMDMNNDGLLDIISVATEHNNSVSWWENQGYNMFEEHIIDENMESHCRYVTAVDIDFDQDP